MLTVDNNLFESFLLGLTETPTLCLVTGSSQGLLGQSRFFLSFLFKVVCYLVTWECHRLFGR